MSDIKCEPFGYFKAEPFGWTDCAETDEGAIALYEAPQQSQEQDELVKKAVAEALEDAAKICDDYANSNFGTLVDSGQNGAYVCAKAIRALIKRNAKGVGDAIPSNK